MNKIEIENILLSIKTSDNEAVINKLLDKVRAVDDVSLQNALTQAGGTKEAITKFFENKISEVQNNSVQKHRPINDAIPSNWMSPERIEKLEKIGEGKCANIYRNGNIVYKIFKKNSDSITFYSKEMLQQLVGLKSSLCIFPSKILYDNNDNLLGYSMDFVNGRKMKDIIAMLPFELLQAAITKAEYDVVELSKQNIMFNDIHDDNIMWNEETQSIQIIDTDFFRKISNNPNLNNINYQKFSITLQCMINSRICQYGITKHKELIPFYDSIRFNPKDVKTLSINEYISNLKAVIENDFGKQFNNLSEIEMALQEKQEEIEEQQHLEQIANNLTIKEKFMRFLTQSKHIRKLPFVNKFIDKQIKMLPADHQKVIANPICNIIQKNTQETNNANEIRKKFNQNLRNWTPTIVQAQKDNTTNTLLKNERRSNDSNNLDL